eukprot:TRINITY_DN1546_c2_g1_i1.p1 TRINITY_DN1546_c2_g1~~TRINITY_DN1546_c2_g1_i1.p1  ORF type:complete len:528 (+),score=30.05 TRINITY_DN1546_c2_g1_i1:47-1630(+)
MAFTNARRRLESLAAFEQELELVVTDSSSPYVRCRGRYVKAHESEKVNGYPFWAGADDMWLYSTPNGYWRITDTTADFQEGLGYIISLEQHNGRPPEQSTAWCAGGEQLPFVTLRKRIPEPIDLYHPSPRRRSSELTSHPIVVSIRKHPSVPMGITFKSPELTIAGIKPGSPASECGLSDYIAWKLTHVNDFRITTPQDLFDRTKGVSACKVRLLPPDGYIEEHRPWDGQDVKVWVTKHADEPLGLQLDDMVLVHVVHGSPAQRCGLSTLLGCTMLHIDGTPVDTLQDVVSLSSGGEGLWLGFTNPSDGSRRGSHASSPPPEALRRTSHSPTMNAQIPIAIEAGIIKENGPLGCRFELHSGELVLIDVSPDSPAGVANMAAYQGRALTVFGGEPVKTIKHVNDIWKSTPEGSPVTAVLEDRRFDRHFKHDRSYTGYLEAYGKWGDKEWLSSPHTTLPQPSYQSWQDKRSAEVYRASSPAEYEDPLPRDGTFTRRTLGLPVAASRPRHFGRGKAAWSSKPSLLGPGKS